MKILTTIFFIFLLIPNAFAQFDDETYFEQMEKEHKSARDKWRSTYDDEPSNYDNPYDIDEKKYKKDRVRPIKGPKKSKNQLDTWGRNGGQERSSESVLQNMMKSTR